MTQRTGARSQFRRPVWVIYKVFITMATYKMLRESLAKFQNIVNYLVSDVFKPRLKLIFLFHF